MTAAPDEPATQALPEAPRGIARYIPGLATLRHYDPAWLTRDLIAGLVLTAVLVPVGMGYAEASGLPAIYGLYATMIPLLAYALFGPSRILVLGPDSSLAALIAATILPLVSDDEAELVALAGGLALLAGAFTFGAGIAKLGFVTDLLSAPIRYGYLNGIALTVLVGQAPKLFGFSVDADGLFDEAEAFIRGVADGLTNAPDLTIGVACIVIILGFKQWLPKVPGVLVAVVGASIVVGLTGTDASTVGALPQGLPRPALPSLPLGDILTLAVAGAAISLVSMADTSVLSRTLAIRAGTRANPDQELIALGSANIATAFVQGFPISSSASRTPVAESAGAKTQLTGVVGAIAIAIMLVFVPGITTNLPNAALAAVVMTACISLVEIKGLSRLWRVRRSEFALSMLCFLGVAVIGVVPGIFFSVGVAIMAFLWRAWRPYSAILGRVDGLKGYHDIERHPEGKQVPGMKLLRWDAPLFFANAEMFRSAVERTIAESATPVRWLVVTAEPVTDVDTTAADVVQELYDEMANSGVKLVFAEVKDPVKDVLRRYGLLQHIGEEHFYPTIGSAVDAYVKESGVDWIDWEDRQAAEGTS